MSPEVRGAAATGCCSPLQDPVFVRANCFHVGRYFWVIFSVFLLPAGGSLCASHAARPPWEGVPPSARAAAHAAAADARPARGGCCRARACRILDTQGRCAGAGAGGRRAPVGGTLGGEAHGSRTGLSAAKGPEVGPQAHGPSCLAHLPREAGLLVPVEGPPPRPSLRPAPGRRGLGQRQAVRLSVSCRPCHAREAGRCRGRNVGNGPKVTPKRFDQRLGPGLLPSPLDLVDRQECTRFTFRRVRPGSRGPWPGLGPARRVRPPSPRVGPPGLRESVGGAEPHPSRGPARLLPVYCGRCVSGERVSRQLLPRALGRRGPSPWRLSPRLCPPARTSPESPSLGLRPRWPA